MLPQHLKHTAWYELQNGWDFYADEVAKVVQEPGYVLKLLGFDGELVAQMNCYHEDRFFEVYADVLIEIKKFNEEVIEEDNSTCPYWDWD